jgi:hypothetical protein
MLLVYFYKRRHKEGIKKREELLSKFFKEVKPDIEDVE